MKKGIFITGGSGFVGQNLTPLLVEKGYIVNALARSERAIDKVEKLGATAINGDLDNKQAIIDGLRGAETVFHLAASVDFFAGVKALYKLHVVPTALLLEESKKAGVKNFVYLSAASVIMNGRPIRNADESFVSDNLIDGYSITKLEAEKSVLQADSGNFRTIAIRPPLIWGKGDPNILPSIIAAIKKGQMQFIGGGLHEIVTCNVRNVCEALLLAEESSTRGQAYFITDGQAIIFKEFIKRYVETQGIDVPYKSVSVRNAKIIASIMECILENISFKWTSAIIQSIGKYAGIRIYH